MAKFTKDKCIAYIYLSWFITPIGTQAYMPTMPLLVRDTLDAGVEMLGYVYSVKMFCSVIGFTVLIPLFKCATPRQISLAMLWMRLLSGLLHAAACWAVTSYSLPLLFVRSALHGISLGTIGLAPTWIGRRLDDSEKAKHQTGILGVLALGMALGPALGSGIAVLLPKDAAGRLASQGAPGYVTAVTSLALIVLTHVLFDDDEPMSPGSPGAKGDERKPKLSAEHKTVTAMTIVIAITSFLATLGAESVQALLFKDMYGYEADGTFIAFVAIGISSMFGAGAFLWLSKRLSLAALAVLWNVWGVIPLITFIPWWAMGEFPFVTEYVPYGQVVFGMFLSFIGSQWSLSAHNSIISIRLPVEHVATIMPIQQLAGQLGRACGPIFFTQVYAAAEDAVPGVAPNWTFWAMMAIMMIGNIAPLFTFRIMYGTFSDGPFVQTKEAELL